MGGFFRTQEAQQSGDHYEEDQMKRQVANYLEITEAEYVSGHKIRLKFSDDTSRVMDFEPLLRKTTNPDLAQYRRLKKFKQFRLHYGDLMWGDYEMIFPVSDLYRGEL
jgi:hypothetical protein